MAKKNLTDRFIQSRKAAPKGKRQDYADAIVPGLALRVTDSGHKSFVLVARYPSNPTNPTRRALGDYGAISLDQARERARGWLELIGRGVDPKVQEARERALQARRQTNSFAAVAAAFLERHVKGPAYVELERLASERRRIDPTLTDDAAFALVCADPKSRALVAKSKQEGIVKKDEAERTVNNEFVSRWGARPVTEIMPEEVAAAIRAIVKRGAPYQAHNAFGYLRRLFNWAIGTNEFGLTSSPAERFRPSDSIGKREARARVLTDSELREVWQAANGLGYPYGPLFRLLILTGQREREVADLQWSEIDLNKRLWTIPKERMKGDRAHEVPLSPDALALLESLPRFNSGPFAFTTTGGEKPVNGFSKAKARLDKAIVDARRKDGVTDTISAWVIHDLRRTVRTHLSALPIEDIVRELVIAHARPGLHKVYDQHTYEAEKRRCLELWSARLDGIVSPKPADIADIAAARSKRARAGGDDAR